jgi:putative zinc finger/helix-turn-helix YgiT family protein
MKTPLECFECGHLVTPTIEERIEVLPVRGEDVEVCARVGVCPHCGVDMSVTELDEATLITAFNTYRQRHGLLAPEEMVRLRERYGLGQRAFSLLLGWGEITLHRYESGSLQDAAHNAQLRMAADPANVRILLEANGHRLTVRQRAKLEVALGALEAGGTASDACSCEDRFVVREEQDAYGGWRKLEVSKLREMMIFFARLPEMFPTKLNKLLFYADFLHFKRHGVSISGSPYLAFPYGPVPDHYGTIRADLCESGALATREVYGPDWGGEILTAERAVDKDLFTAEELETLQEVATGLAGLTASRIAELSHKEAAWSNTPHRDMISYEWAKELKAIGADDDQADVSTLDVTREAPPNPAAR